MSRQAVFMIGEQRSGSNLLRLILNKSKDLAAPHPPHILLNFYNLLPVYGNLKEEVNFRLLIDDVCNLVERNPVPWTRMGKISRDRIYHDCQNRSLLDVYEAIINVYAEAHNSNIWLCKSMQNVRWISELEQYFNNPKYIYLYRDPRDVTYSFMKAVVGYKHPYCIAKKWTELQQMCIDAKKNIEANRMYAIQYEDLIANPKKEIRNLCDFLGIEYDDELLKYHKSEEAINTASVSDLWKNVDAPMMRENAYKFKRTLSKDDRLLIESVSSEVIKVLGYEREFRDDDLLNLDESAIKTFYRQDEELQRLSEKNIQLEDLKRRKHQLAVISEIKNRKSQKYV